MKSKKTIVWIGTGVGLLLLVMCIVILRKPSAQNISRASAYRSVALAMTSDEECQNLESERLVPYFQAKDQEQWYVKYINYLYETGFLDTEETKPEAAMAEGWLTYQDAERLALRISESDTYASIDTSALKLPENVSRKKLKSPMPAEEWWQFYDSLLAITDGGQIVETTELTIYGTPQNIKDTPAWTMYTNNGEYNFEGLGMDTYIDTTVLVMVRSHAVIRVKEVVTDSVIYENVWLSESGKEDFIVHLGGIEREFAKKASLGSTESLVNNVADIYLESGRLKKVVLKKERITGKVLTVKDNALEIEGYGNVVLDDNFKIYKVYGDFEEQKMTDILVGYDIQEFVVAGGKVCAALTVRPFDAKSIRVMIMDTGFNSIFHSSITLSAQVQMFMSYGDQEYAIEPGEQIVLSPEDERFSEGRIIFRLQSAQDEISVSSIKRAQGAPAYSGTLEVKKEKDGLILTNELFLEDYLTKVVPSEMPSSYEMEALKAQAVCARTYAYKQIQGNTYSEYGAHVDDSTRFQVYNNIATDAKTQAAVSDTYGKMLVLNGNPVEAYYFSTSCGHTTDGTIWGADASAVPYLQGVLLKEGKDILNLTNNDNFAAFIKDKAYVTYETGFPFYRWETVVNSLQLEKMFPGIGSILNMTVTERGPGGIVKTMRIDGSDGSKTIKGQSEVRTSLGNKEFKITKNDGDTISGWSTLPSAFIAIENDGINENNVITFHIYGGGYGHGVGMSQNGAQGMAKAGMKYEDILKFFYEGVEVKGM